MVRSPMAILSQLRVAFGTAISGVTVGVTGTGGGVADS